VPSVRRRVDETTNFNTADDPVEISLTSAAQMRQHVQGAKACRLASILYRDGKGFPAGRQSMP
jgi:hypothetical protein